jgi:hypothetical protein
MYLSYGVEVVKVYSVPERKKNKEMSSGAPTARLEKGNTRQQRNVSSGPCNTSSIIYTRPLDHLCYCTSSRKSILFLRPKPHLHMNSGTGPLSPATQGCPAAACRVMRSPGSANKKHEETKSASVYRAQLAPKLNLSKP